MVIVGCNSRGSKAGASVEDISKGYISYIGKGYISYTSKGCCKIRD